MRVVGFVCGLGDDAMISIYSPAFQDFIAIDRFIVESVATNGVWHRDFRYEPGLNTVLDLLLAGF